VVPSGLAFRRPKGQIRPRDAEAPVYAASRALDFEAELGFFVGPGNLLGETVAVGEAEDRIFGFCLLNDWSARDIQGWEYQPLGPFLGKSFASTISPWVVTSAALAPFRCPDYARPAGDPAPLPYLALPQGGAEAGLDIAIEVLLLTPQMRERGVAAQRIALCNARNTYWTVAQMLTHHASNGCNLCPGDLLGTGTLSGPAEESLGSLLEITRRGSTPLRLDHGEERRWLEDGDELILRGRAERAGCVGIGLGEARARVLPAA
jgi:fumarylacetoacetase